jgi:hypothetical protein
MNAFVNGARQIPDSRTENGAATFSTSLSPLVDMFFKMGASRGQIPQALGMFKSALDANRSLAIRLMLWGRDCRGGCGERELFRNMFINLSEVEQMSLIDKVVEVGRWDDLLVVFDSCTWDVQSEVAEKWREAVVEAQKAVDILQNIDNLTEEECQEILCSIS